MSNEAEQFFDSLESQMRLLDQIMQTPLPSENMDNTNYITSSQRYYFQGAVGASDQIIQQAATTTNVSFNQAWTGYTYVDNYTHPNSVNIGPFTHQGQIYIDATLAPNEIEIPSPFNFFANCKLIK